MDFNILQVLGKFSLNFITQNKMSKLKSFNNNRLSHNQFDYSINVQDFIKQNQLLKQSIEELIQQNTQLTEIIEELNNHQIFSAGDNMTNINQQEIEALAHQVIQLQQQLQVERYKSAKNSQPDVDAEQTIRIIEELSSQFQNMQQHYQKQIQKLLSQLQNQKGQCQNILESTQTKFNKTIEQYNMLHESLKQKDDRITELQSRLNETLHANKKQLKISTTIQDLRFTLEKQIDEKQKVINKYEQLVKSLRSKLSQK